MRGCSYALGTLVFWWVCWMCLVKVSPLSMVTSKCLTFYWVLDCTCNFCIVWILRDDSYLSLERRKCRWSIVVETALLLAILRLPDVWSPSPSSCGRVSHEVDDYSESSVSFRWYFGSCLVGAFCGIVRRVIFWRMPLLHLVILMSSTYCRWDRLLRILPAS